MTAGPSRALATTTLLCALLSTSAACAARHSAGSPAVAEPKGSWSEPASYSYTLTSTTQVLAGTFRVDVRDGRVAKAVGLDESSRRQARDLPGRVPTIGDLLTALKQARDQDADTADAEYAADGRPVRITLDPDENAIDDETLYVISAYEGAPTGRHAPASGPAG